MWNNNNKYTLSPHANSRTTTGNDSGAKASNNASTASSSSSNNNAIETVGGLDPVATAPISPFPSEQHEVPPSVQPIPSSSSSTISSSSLVQRRKYSIGISNNSNHNNNNNDEPSSLLKQGTTLLYNNRSNHSKETNLSSSTTKTSTSNHFNNKIGISTDFEIRPSSVIDSDHFVTMQQSSSSSSSSAKATPNCNGTTTTTTTITSVATIPTTPITTGRSTNYQIFDIGSNGSNTTSQMDSPSDGGSTYPTFIGSSSSSSNSSCCSNSSHPNSPLNPVTLLSAASVSSSSSPASIQLPFSKRSSTILSSFFAFGRRSNKQQQSEHRRTRSSQYHHKSHPPTTHHIAYQPYNHHSNHNHHSPSHHRTRMIMSSLVKSRPTLSSLLNRKNSLSASLSKSVSSSTTKSNLHRALLVTVAIAIFVSINGVIVIHRLQNDVIDPHSVSASLLFFVGYQHPNLSSSSSSSNESKGFSSSSSLWSSYLGLDDRSLNNNNNRRSVRTISTTNPEHDDSSHLLPNVLKKIQQNRIRTTTANDINSVNSKAILNDIPTMRKSSPVSAVSRRSRHDAAATKSYPVVVHLPSEIPYTSSSIISTMNISPSIDSDENPNASPPRTYRFHQRDLYKHHYSYMYNEQFHSGTDDTATTTTTTVTAGTDIEQDDTNLGQSKAPSSTSSSQSSIVLSNIKRTTEQQYYHNKLHRLDEYLEPDYNYLHIKSLVYEGNNFERVVIEPYDDAQYNKYRDAALYDYDEIYVSAKYDFFDDIDFTMSEDECVRPQWTFSYYPNCQAFHELVDPALQSTIDIYDDDSGDDFTHGRRRKFNRRYRRRNRRASHQWKNQYGDSESESGKTNVPNRVDDIRDNTIPTVEYLAHGFYRDTWVFYPPEGSHETINSYAVKHLRMYHDQDIRSLEKIKTEALVMERLAGSPVITNIYGHCGTSTMVEMANEITNDIVPYDKKYMPTRGRVKQSVLDKVEKGRKKPFSFNNYTVEEKLNIAIAMAEAIAEQHGYRESVIVNDDAHPDQWLVTDDGRYILNDMNNAIFLKWNFVKQEYCKYYSTYGGDYRAPEEVSDDGAYVDETVDIWPMGNLLFSLLTGLWPYYTLMTDRDVQRISNQGYKPYLNPKFLTSSFIERKIIDVMNQCHELNPTDRISIFEVVDQLKEIRKIYEATQGKAIKTMIKKIQKTDDNEENNRENDANSNDNANTDNETTDNANNKDNENTDNQNIDND